MMHRTLSLARSSAIRTRLSSQPQQRAFHTPFAVLSSSSTSTSSANTSTAPPVTATPAHYEKAYDDVPSVSVSQSTAAASSDAEFQHGHAHAYLVSPDAPHPAHASAAAAARGGSDAGCLEGGGAGEGRGWMERREDGWREDGGRMGRRGEAVRGGGCVWQDGRRVLQCVRDGMGWDEHGLGRREGYVSSAVSQLALEAAPISPNLPSRSFIQR
ncbi:hypothetical protein SCHPADRAFT_886182 [Schizopora paradoxa]|uniref:Uncharacterized protein n=1 Tax=Schizopora paradoxa TaxID=27342 RepID=A0A0H2S2D4_9AGAM|nr:hypothetical protein SCHPADRAFT_886182 [Schizopora paradoxa]